MERELIIQKDDKCVAINPSVVKVFSWGIGINSQVNHFSII